uniref:Uncharacterized protein n=1 Tax=Astatotilapia calliptera TaxID=8154 RepID=A0A3P8QC78_ASTCA
MSAAGNLQSEDQITCSICLNVFTDPVSTPCGHNFCKNCISQHWKTNRRYICPICNKVFKRRPELDINTLFSEMVAQCRREALQNASSSEQQAAKPGEVPCDVCTGTTLKALKSCLVCQTSYCQTHLEPHLRVKGLKRHQLIDAVENLEGRVCTKHDKLLELFCKTDQTCVCMLCPVLDHKSHEFVPLKEEYEGKKAELEKTEAEIQQKIQKRRLKIQEIKESVKMSKDRADLQKRVEVRVREQSFSSGRFYFEVEVKGKTEWDLGVARESIDRRSNIILSPQNGFWTVLLRNGNEYKACAAPPVRLCLQPGPEKVGVFVDYEEGLVSFYDVDAAALIYSFTGCSFTHKLHPYFGPSLNHGGNNSAPLIICPVNHPIND